MYGDDEWASKYGYRAIATPGELAGYWLAYREFGSGRVPWSELVMPSVALARRGVPVSEYYNFYFQYANYNQRVSLVIAVISDKCSP